MKVLVFSDSHGASALAEEMLRRESDCQLVFFLGDGIDEAERLKERYKEKKFLIDRFSDLPEVNSGTHKLNEAKMLTENGRYAEAIDLYRDLLRNTILGVPFEYRIYCDMEICFRELKDYEGAYKYSQMAKKLFEDMQV